jgi:hypothetical protein
MEFYNFTRGLKDPVRHYKEGVELSMQLYRGAMRTNHKDTIVTRACSNLDFAIEDSLKFIYLKYCT